MLLLALQFGSGSTYPWNSSQIIGLFIGAFVTFVLFGLWERHVGNELAMIPGSVAGNRIVWTSSVQCAALIVSVQVTNNYLPLYFQAVRGASPTESGVYLLPSILTQLLFVIISGAAGESRFPRWIVLGCADWWLQ